MKRLEVELGGEPSGHVIIRSLQRSGDGLLSGLHFFAALSDLGLSGQDLLRHRLRFPQGLKSIRVNKKPDLKAWGELQSLEQDFARRTCGRNARQLIRYSGTENKIRIMVESDDAVIVDAWMSRFEDFIMQTIGEKR
jgi:phosphoglucosamine mutase